MNKFYQLHLENEIAAKSVPPHGFSTSHQGRLAHADSEQKANYTLGCRDARRGSQTSDRNHGFDSGYAALFVNDDEDLTLDAIEDGEESGGGETKALDKCDPIHNLLRGRFPDSGVFSGCLINLDCEATGVRHFGKH